MNIGSVTVIDPTDPTRTTSVSLNNNVTGTPDFGPPIIVAGSPYTGTSDSPYNRLNAAAFTLPGPGSIGIESRRNYLNTPGMNNWDMSLQKSVGLTEHAHMEFRVDAFNVFNHTQFNGVNSTLNFNITSSIVNGVITNFNPVPSPGGLAINPTNNKINTGGFGAVSGVRPARILQTVVRVVF